MYSVVIPLFNKENSIAKTLESVLLQTYKNFEVIIINDGSTDKSQKVVEGFDDYRIRLINKKNGGVSSARNTGIRNSSYDWIAFIDGDDLWEPTFLEEMDLFIKENPEAKMYGCAFDNMEGGRYFSRNFYLPDTYKGIIHNYFIHAKKNLLFWPTSTIISKSAIEYVGGFDERISMGEDIDLWIRLAYNFKVAFYNKVLAHYTQDGPNRAMKRKHEFTKNYLFYTEKFKIWEGEKKDFRTFINAHRLSRIIELHKDYNLGKRQIFMYINMINLQDQDIKYQIFLKLPYYLQKLIVRLIY